MKIHIQLTLNIKDGNYAKIKTNKSEEDYCTNLLSGLWQRLQVTAIIQSNGEQFQ